MWLRGSTAIGRKGCPHHKVSGYLRQVRWAARTCLCGIQEDVPVCSASVAATMLRMQLHAMLLQLFDRLKAIARTAEVALQRVCKQAVDCF